MKRNFLLPLLILTLSTGFLFGKGADIPKFLFAENVNSAAMILTRLDVRKPVQHTWVGGTKYVDAKDYSNMDEALWQEMIRVITTNLKELGIEPNTVLKMNMANMNSGEDPYTGEYQKYKPYFNITFTLMDNKKIAKKYKKQGKLEPDDIKPVAFSISKVGETNPSNIYMVTKMNASLKDVFDQLEKDIKDKNDSYFIDKVDDAETERVEEIYKESAENKALKKGLETETGEEHETFPKDIKDSKLLVIHDYFTNSGRSSMDSKALAYVSRMRKLLEKHYPGKYRLIHRTMLSDELKESEYKYVMMPLVSSAVKTKTKRDDDTNLIESKSEMSSQSYYVVKEYGSNDVYYGPKKEELIDNKQSAQTAAIKNTLKFMKDFYGWE